MMKFMGENLTDKEITVGEDDLDDRDFTPQMIIDEADIDHDGQIDYTEFFSMMQPK